MSTWEGNINNPAPNIIQESSNRSEKNIGHNRAEDVRRDLDSQKNLTITLLDVDSAIKFQLDKMELTVVDAGNIVKVPIIYGSPEKWVSSRRDGYMRDNQGKIILPAIMFKRTNSENDPGIQTLNRYLSYSVLKKYSQKNKYTKFAMLANQNAPVNEIYNITMPDHMLFTYHFIVWTEYVEQMNSLVEKIKFNADDYWGDPKRFKFRVNIDSISHTVDNSDKEDRIVKSEFDLQVHGYLLPEEHLMMNGHKQTTSKTFTPKKVIFHTEVVSTDTELKNPTDEKWRNIQYPNLPKSEPIKTAPWTFGDITSETDLSKILPSTFQSVSGVINSGGGGSSSSSTTSNVTWHSPPATSTEYGEEGWMAFDQNYYYIYSNNKWRRVSIGLFS